jgi:hypothetical protein
MSTHYNGTSFDSQASNGRRRNHLSEAEVRAIRQGAAQGVSRVRLAALYHTSMNNVAAILAGKTWRQVH